MDRIVSTPLRQLCRTCPKSYPPRELYLGLCRECWQKRIENVTRGFNSQEFGSFNCFECKRPIPSMSLAYLHWVTDANSFGLFCLPCSDNKYFKDRQYRNMPVAYQKKIQ